MAAPDRSAEDARAPDRATEARAVSAPGRGAYAKRQAQLLDALLRGDGYPHGFVAAHADAAGHSLRRKRARLVANAWPALALDAAVAFDGCFDAYARETGAPASGDPLADGLAFACSLGRGVRLGDAARVELLLARATLHRRGLFVRTAWLRRPYARLLVVVRLPLLGTGHRSFARRRPR